MKHGDTQAQVSHFLRPYRGRRAPGGGAGGSSPAQLGGWWISQEVDLFLAGVGCRPDVVGWRRDRHARVPQPNAQGVITERPDFVCEVLSPSTARYDQCDKLDAYLDAGVPNYWIVDPETSLLMVLERTERGYLIARVAGPGELVRAAPFEGVEIPVEELFLDEEGDRSDDDPPSSSNAPTSDQKKVSPTGAREKAPSSSPPSAPATGVKKRASRRSG